MTRCDLRTHGECSCEPSGVPCKVQDHGNPGPLHGLPKMMRDITYAFIAAIAIASLVTAAFYPALSKVERAYKSNGRV